jgi:hypothetical protein
MTNNREIRKIVDEIFDVAHDFQLFSIQGRKGLFQRQNYYIPGVDLFHLDLTTYPLPSLLEGELFMRLIMQGPQLIAKFIENPSLPGPLFSLDMLYDSNLFKDLKEIVYFNLVIRHELLLHRMAFLSCAEMMQWMMLVHSLSEKIDIETENADLTSKQIDFLHKQHKMFRNRLLHDIAFIIEGQAVTFDFVTLYFLQDWYDEFKKIRQPFRPDELSQAKYVKKVLAEDRKRYFDILDSYAKDETKLRHRWYSEGQKLFWPVFKVFGLEGVLAASLIALNPVGNSDNGSAWHRMEKIIQMLPSSPPRHLDWQQVDDSTTLIGAIGEHILEKLGWTPPAEVFENKIQWYAEELDTHGLPNPLHHWTDSGTIRFSYDFSGLHFRERLYPTIIVTAKGDEVNYSCNPEYLLLDDKFWQDYETGADISGIGNLFYVRLCVAQELLNHMLGGKKYLNLNLGRTIKNCLSHEAE